MQVAKNELEKIPEIDLCIGTNDKVRIVELVEEFLKNERTQKIEFEQNEKNIEKIKVQEDIFNNKEFQEFGIVTYTEKTRCVIKVQDGCDRFCSYCIIPYARGRVRSRNPQSVIKEISNVAEKGIKEVVITGIHVASYGKDFQNDYNLIDLLEDINKINGIKRIRLGSIEPLLITEEFIERFSKLEKMCHHFHLSLQSGCDKILKRMNRKYTCQEFEKIVKIIRNKLSDSILTTDIIVGFPGETEEDFEETYEYLKKINFYKMHIFKYSVRKGTKAALMENQVSPDIKEIRSKRLLELSDINENEYLKSYIGKNVEVLFEEKDREYWKGHTSNYLYVEVKSNENLHNKICKVKLKEIDNLIIIGEVISC